MHEDVEAELGAHNVLAQVTGGISLVQSLVQALDAGQKFTTAVDVGRTATKCPSGDNQAFNQTVRIF